MLADGGGVILGGELEPFGLVGPHGDRVQTRQVQVEHVLIGRVVGQLVADLHSAERRHRTAQRQAAAVGDGDVVG